MSVQLYERCFCYIGKCVGKSEGQQNSEIWNVITEAKNKEIKIFVCVLLYAVTGYVVSTIEII